MGWRWKRRNVVPRLLPHRHDATAAAAPGGPAPAAPTRSHRSPGSSRGSRGAQHARHRNRLSHGCRIAGLRGRPPRGSGDAAGEPSCGSDAVARPPPGYGQRSARGTAPGRGLLALLLPQPTHLERLVPLGATQGGKRRASKFHSSSSPPWKSVLKSEYDSLCANLPLSRLWVWFCPLVWSKLTRQTKKKNY